MRARRVAGLRAAGLVVSVSVSATMNAGAFIANSPLVEKEGAGSSAGAATGFAGAGGGCVRSYSWKARAIMSDLESEAYNGAEGSGFEGWTGAAWGTASGAVAGRSG